jgi:predicted nucleotidyltransferase
MIYTLEQIAERIRPVAEKYKLPNVWIFGSYARGEANDDSDVDILVDTENSRLSTMLQVNSLFADLTDSFEKPVDMVETDCLQDKIIIERNPFFIENLLNERIQIL